jgi:hypothetical protein
VGSVGEAAFFGALFLLGIVSLTIVVSWQVFWPESTILKPGFGFWLMVIASGSFMVIGLTAFLLQVSHTLASPEKRYALVSQAKQQHSKRAQNQDSNTGTLPNIQGLTDSPGVKLAYRLPVQRGENTQLILSAIFTTTWNAVTAVLSVVTLQEFLSHGANWFLSVLLVLFLAVAFYSTRWFFQLFRRKAGIGPTAIEIDYLPLLPGNRYRVYLCQYGRVVFNSLQLALVAFEEATYEQGTDIRTEIRETQRIPIRINGPFVGSAGGERSPRAAKPSSGPSTQTDKALKSSGDVSEGDNLPLLLEAEPEKPLELDCTICLPADMMHSFQSEHNSLVWKIVVEGECPKWPEFCRSFPVAVYPRSAA